MGGPTEVWKKNEEEKSSEHETNLFGWTAEDFTEKKMAKQIFIFIKSFKSLCMGTLEGKVKQNGNVYFHYRTIFIVFV